MINTDPSPVKDTSSGTGFADMSTAVETEHEKKQDLHYDQYNENLTGGEEDFEVDVGDEYAEMEEEEMLVRALPSATVSASANTAEAMSLADSTDPIGVSKSTAVSTVELTEEQKQIAIQRLAGREAAKAAENAAAEDSSGASIDGRRHMSKHIAHATLFTTSLITSRPAFSPDIR
jgi:hypothetical protein